MIDKELAYYVWLAIVSFIGGILNFTKRKAKGQVFSLGAFLFGVVSSMFVAYITFEFTNYFFHNERFAVAIAGLSAWMGTDALLALEGAFKKKLDE